MKCRLIILLIFMATGLCGYAAQVIFIDVAHYIPADSQFGVEVKGNKWISFADPEAIRRQGFRKPW